MHLLPFVEFMFTRQASDIIICLPLQICLQEKSRFVQPSIGVSLINLHSSLIHWLPVSSPCDLFCG